MQYAGFLIRQERLSRNWSQEGLCKGICTVSYLSKIEQGKVEPSDEIAAQLLRRMDIPWYPSQETDRQWIENAYELLFSSRIKEFVAAVSQQDCHRMSHGPYSIDWMLLTRFSEDRFSPLDKALETQLDSRQLALQRCLQKREQEALLLCPKAFFYFFAGDRYYRRGDVSAALEHLQTAYDLAAREGNVRTMLLAKITMGNCYSNIRDLAAMEGHYRIAARLAEALNDQEALDTILYNTAATRLDSGSYAEASDYFENLSDHNKMTLHKLAICYEKLDRPGQALTALDQADQIPPQEHFPAGLEQQMCDVVRFRLEHTNYLDNPQYGALLLSCFKACRKKLPSGFAIFHLPWVLEWYEHQRQYKQAYGLLRDFPEYSRRD